ncbi:MAG: type 4a pilus biogenesis protein PilO [Thermodesulfobacteriota bacterium]
MDKINLSLDSIEPFFKKIADLTRLQRILICVAAVVVIVAVFVFFFYKPKYEEMGRLQSNIEKQEKKLARTKRNAKEFAKYKKKIEDARAQFEEVSRALPNKEEIPSLLTGISQAGKSSGLNFLLFQPQSEKKEGFYAKIPISMELSGTYHELGEFFDKLAGMSRIVNVDSFALDKQADNRLKISCRALTYKFIEQSDKKKK